MTTDIFLERLERLAELFKSPNTRLPELILLEVQQFRKQREGATTERKRYEEQPS